jgi:hypothetical protein
MSAAALPLIAMGVQAAGQIVQGVSANSAARRAAKVDEENARLSILQGEEEASLTARDERSLAGEMLAAMAGGGGDLQGSNLDIIGQSAYNRELDIEQIRRQRRGEAANLVQSADDKRRAGKNALIGAGFGALSTVISGVSAARNARLVRAQQSSEQKSTKPTYGGNIKMPSSSTGYATGARVGGAGGYTRATVR